MRYLTTIKGDRGSLMDCYYINEGGRSIATVTPVNHNLGALEFARVLEKAAEWFRCIAPRGKEGS